MKLGAFIALSTAASLFILYIGVPTLICIVLRLVFILRLRQGDGKFHLTFDDGPSSQLTPKILKALTDAGTQGTFFILGRNAELHPEIIEEAIRLGHKIGEHTYNHFHPWRTGPLRTARDLARSSRTINRHLSNQKQILFRPPYGKLNLVILLYILLKKRKVVFWSIDPQDYLAKQPMETASYVINRLRSLGNVKGSQVVLLHDGRPNNCREISADAVTGVSLLLNELLARGFNLASIDELNRND